MKTKRILLIVVLVALVILLGLWLWQRQKPQSNSQKPPTSNQPKQSINNPPVTFNATYSNNTWTYSGTVELPNPCSTLTHDAIVMESFPEQVQVRLTTTSDPTAVCAQVVTTEEYSGTFAASEQAKISVYLNGVLVQ